MITFTLKKIIYGTFVLWGVLTLVFFLFKILPGDPARMMLDKREDSTQLAVIKHMYGFDRSLLDQYILYLNDVSPISVHHNSPTSFTSLANKKYKYVQLFNFSEYTSLLKAPYLRESFVRTGTPVTTIRLHSFVTI